MDRQKLSVSISASLASFLESYRRAYALRSKSAVVERALEGLREQELEREYVEASRDVDPAWEATTADGLRDESW